MKQNRIDWFRVHVVLFNVFVCSTVFLMLWVGAIVLVNELGNWNSVVIADVSQPIRLTLENRPMGWWFPFDLDASGLSVRITGDINGTAEVSVAHYPVERLSGKVDWMCGGDFFTNECLMEYKALGPVSGTLTVHYKFY